MEIVDFLNPCDDFHSQKKIASEKTFNDGSEFNSSSIIPISYFITPNFIEKFAFVSYI